MRTITLLAVMAITITVLASHFLLENTATEQPQAVTSQTGTTSTSEVQDKLDNLASVLQGYQQTNQARWQQTKLQQSRLHKKLADLDTRLRSVETASSEPTANGIVPNIAFPL